jgi:hypothetical protein
MLSFVLTFNRPPHIGLEVFKAYPAGMQGATCSITTTLPSPRKFNFHK